MSKVGFFNNVKYIAARICARRVSAVKNSEISGKAAIGNGTQIVDSVVGRYTYIYESRVVNAEIGSFCSIAPNCTIGGARHSIEWVSTSPVFNNGRNVMHKNFSGNTYEYYSRAVIGNDVWIGSQCLIKGGVSIGDGAVVGMGSVVTHDISPYEIWAGNPAKFLRKRFSDEITAELLKIKWWTWDEEKIAKYADLFNDPEKFVEQLNDEK